LAVARREVGAREPEVQLVHQLARFDRRRAAPQVAARDRLELPVDQREQRLARVDRSVAQAAEQHRDLRGRVAPHLPTSCARRPTMSRRTARSHGLAKAVGWPLRSLPRVTENTSATLASSVDLRAIIVRMTDRTDLDHLTSRGQALAATGSRRLL